MNLRPLAYEASELPDCSTPLYRGGNRSLNLTYILYQKFLIKSNVRFFLVSNATTRADGLGRSLVCRQERPTRYIQSYLTTVLGLTEYPLFLATLDPGPGNRSLLRFRLRKFLNPRDNQTSVGLHNHALVETIGIEPILGGRSLPLSSQRPIPIWSK